MAPTTVTTIAMFLFALLVFSLTAYAWLGSWDPFVRRVGVEESDPDVEAAVHAMRLSIEDYERRQRS